MHCPGLRGPCNLFSYKDSLYYQTLVKRLLHKRGMHGSFNSCRNMQICFRAMNAKNTGQIASCHFLQSRVTLGDLRRSGTPWSSIVVLIICVVHPLLIAQSIVSTLYSWWGVCCPLINLSPGIPTGKELAVPALLRWLPSLLRGCTHSHA